ncbi:uncharacterized protein EV420DRAFT_1486048 [Desarmillaria tabescens]|uniref:Uncharacterized protein n=1 Tax=Armillaria tabescens TaxID=1929756 RepID=A0AA39JD79_ARMTA|nr:uncharacterized protein EV420DRAFT_1486048 [Desarmillaria tabescens]KAK0440219.1 hypothetical protein EV420DRAFT_1486048 [Desarmillaria tabescens]
MNLPSDGLPTAGPYEFEARPENRRLVPVDLGKQRAPFVGKGQRALKVIGNARTTDESKGLLCLTCSEDYSESPLIDSGGSGYSTSASRSPSMLYAPVHDHGLHSSGMSCDAILSVGADTDHTFGMNVGARLQLVEVLDLRRCSGKDECIRSFESEHNGEGGGSQREYVSLGCRKAEAGQASTEAGDRSLLSQQSWIDNIAGRRVAERIYCAQVSGAREGLERDQDHDDPKTTCCCKFGSLNVDLATEKCYEYITSLALVIVPTEPSSSPSPNPALAAWSSLGAHLCTFDYKIIPEKPDLDVLIVSTSTVMPTAVDHFERIDGSMINDGNQYETLLYPWWSLIGTLLRYRYLYLPKTNVLSHGRISTVSSGSITVMETRDNLVMTYNHQLSPNPTEAPKPSYKKNPWLIVRSKLRNQDTSKFTTIAF